jgi:phosphoglycerate dehydrogenase-like enzyme
MREGAIFVSIGRGLAVDEAALVRALRGERLRGAALDVFEEEPLSPSSALWDCEKLLLTAHNADFTASYFDLGWEVWRQNSERFVRGEPLATLVDTAAGY